LLKNCQTTLKREDAGNEAKVRNMQTILEKSADIFHHIYTKKLAAVSKQHEAKENALVGKINLLSAENGHLREEKVRSEEHRVQVKEQEKRKEKLEGQLNVLGAEKEKLQGKLKEVAEEAERKTREQQHALEESRKEVSRLKT
jgi:hypothetical protein